MKPRTVTPRFANRARALGALLAAAAGLLSLTPTAHADDMQIILGGALGGAAGAAIGQSVGGRNGAIIGAAAGGAVGAGMVQSHQGYRYAAPQPVYEQRRYEQHYYVQPVYQQQPAYIVHEREFYRWREEPRYEHHGHGHGYGRRGYESRENGRFRPYDR